VKPLVVIGDVLLDVDVATEANRLTPDGPAPVLEQRDRTERAGGAALAAACAVARYAGPVVLIAPLAEDAAAARITELLDPKLRVRALKAAGRTPMKTRLRCGATTVARLDDGDAKLGLQLSAADLTELAAELADASAVLVSDYGGGTTDNAALRGALAEAARRVPVVWDPHPRGGAPVPRITLATPNAAEAARLAPSADRATPRAHGEAARERWQARAVAVTLGARGALLVDGSGRCTAFPAAADVTGDACGAGDCFAAAATAALATGALPSDAVQAAVRAATDFVAAGGVAADPSSPQTDDAALDDFVRRHRTLGSRIVATGGCFDLLHAGHIATLEAARRLGDCLVVCVNSDASVRRAKGPGRPLQPAADRSRVLRALRAVDRVVVFDEDTPLDVLDRIRPDVWVKGDDYNVAELPETGLVRSWGGEVVTVPYLSGHSTTRLVERSRPR
jgi:D-beta-D-heptose 7-phosphate kinase / D-beta-D-heptose 1-phosphate adenosyltransferase